MGLLSVPERASRPPIVHLAQPSVASVRRSRLRYQPQRVASQYPCQASFCASCTSRTASRARTAGRDRPGPSRRSASRRVNAVGDRVAMDAEAVGGVADAGRLQDGPERGQSFAPGGRPAAEDRREQVARVAQAVRQVVQRCPAIDTPAGGPRGARPVPGPAQRPLRASRVPPLRPPVATRPRRTAVDTATGRPTNSATIAAGRESVRVVGGRRRHEPELEALGGAAQRDARGGSSWRRAPPGRPPATAMAVRVREPPWPASRTTQGGPSAGSGSARRVSSRAWRTASARASSSASSGTIRSLAIRSRSLAGSAPSSTSAPPPPGHRRPPGCPSAGPRWMAWPGSASPQPRRPVDPRGCAGPARSPWGPSMATPRPSAAPIAAASASSPWPRSASRARSRWRSSAWRSSSARWLTRKPITLRSSAPGPIRSARSTVRPISTAAAGQRHEGTLVAPTAADEHDPGDRWPSPAPGDRACLGPGTAPSAMAASDGGGDHITSRRARGCRTPGRAASAP